MQEVAGRMSLAYFRKGTDVPLADDGSSLRDAFEFGTQTTARLDHCFVGQRDGQRLSICDLTESTSSASSEGNSQTSRRRRTVCVMPVEGLPEFTLAPRKRHHALLAALGMGGVSFAPEFLPGDDREAAQRFEDHWRLEASEPLATAAAEASDVVARERGVRQFFTTGLMRELDSLRGWSLSVRRGQLIVWRGKGFASPADRADLAAVAVKIRALLGEARLSPRGVEVPEAAGETATVRGRQSIGSVAGGLAGGFIGFFGGFGAFVSLLGANSMQGSLGMVLFFVSPFAGAAAGGLLGALLGGRIARRMKFSPVPAPPGQKPGGAWATAGVMLGFMGGGAIGLGCLGLADQLLGPNMMPAWIVFPTFFAFPIFGLVVGGIAGARVQGYRAQRKSALRDDQQAHMP
jgi:hypothetical protein